MMLSIISTALQCIGFSLVYCTHGG